jgi:hypothetical protein
LSLIANRNKRIFKFDFCSAISDSTAVHGDVITSRPGRCSIATAAIARALLTRWSCRSVNTASSPSAFDTATQPRRSNKTTIPDSKRETDLLFQLCAVEVVEGVIRQTCVSEATTMIVIGIILSFISLGFLCWLLFALAVHALPVFVAFLPAWRPTTSARVRSAPSLLD